MDIESFLSIQLCFNKKKLLKNFAIILLFLLFTICSCKDEKQKWMLTNFSSKDWDIYRMRGKTYKNPKYGYYFDRNGKCIYYFYSINSAGRIEKNKFDFDDVIYPETWSVSNDATINILGTPYKLLYLTTDTMIINNRANKLDTLYLKQHKI